MNNRNLDAIVFGATGFTGQIVVEDALDILKEFKWGIAGRNESKLKDVLKNVSQRVKKDLSHIPIIVADVSDQKSIENMANMCKIVINCCGPYRLYGEVVVKACVEAGTHHVDISGEPQYFNKMQLEYNELAEEKGAYVVSTCAFESLPHELGVLYTENVFPGIVNSIELYAEFNPNYQDTTSKAALHSGTWESVVYAMQYWREISSIDRKLNSEKLPRLRPKLRINPFVRKTEGLNSYFSLFPGTDRDVVLRSQRLFYTHEKKRPVQFEMYMGFKSFIWCLILPATLFLVAIMAQFGCTRKILLKYPQKFTFGLMTHEGPIESNRKAMEFTMTLKAKGWSKDTSESSAPNKEVIVRVTGKDPCYGFTSTGLVTCAKVILEEHQNMPGNGGVFPPGFAFAKTKLIEKISRSPSGLKFEVVKS